eukprot:1602409-Rhodomonas_salina.1
MSSGGRGPGREASVSVWDSRWPLCSQSASDAAQPPASAGRTSAILIAKPTSWHDVWLLKGAHAPPETSRDSFVWLFTRPSPPLLPGPQTTSTRGCEDRGNSSAKAQAQLRPADHTLLAANNQPRTMLWMIVPASSISWSTENPRGPISISSSSAASLPDRCEISDVADILNGLNPSALADRIVCA